MLISIESFAFGLLRKHPRLIKQAAQRIAAVAFRECSVLDALWLTRNSGVNPYTRNRRHKQFLGELLGFFLCAEGLQYREHGVGEVSLLVKALAEELREAALDDPGQPAVPLAMADLEHKRCLRFHRHIVGLRDLCGFVSGDSLISTGDLITLSAERIAEIQWERGSPAFVSDLEWIAPRLRWAADGLARPLRIETRIIPQSP